MLSGLPVLVRSIRFLSVFLTQFRGLLLHSSHTLIHDTGYALETNLTNHHTQHKPNDQFEHDIS